jgi:hypothetical protein
MILTFIILMYRKYVFRSAERRMRTYLNKENFFFGAKNNKIRRALGVNSNIFFLRLPPCFHIVYAEICFNMRLYSCIELRFFIQIDGF